MNASTTPAPAYRAREYVTPRERLIFLLAWLAATRNTPTSTPTI